MLAELSDIVVENGNMLLEWCERCPELGHEESPHKFRSPADAIAHKLLTKKLSGLSQKIPIISEENSKSWVYPRPNKYWLIDPLDGTASFVQGYPGFVTQVALMEDAIPVLSAVYAPAFRQLYVAELGKGAFDNGQRMSVCAKPATSIIDCFLTPQGITKKLYDRLGLRFYTECGSIGLKICRVASGWQDIFVKDVVLHDWDIAPGQLILKEAGGFIYDVDSNLLRYDKDNYTQNGIIAVNTQETASRIGNYMHGVCP